MISRTLYGKLLPVAGLLCLTVLLAILVSSAHSQSFHSGGVGSCSGCHAMHDGTPTTDQPLLLQADASSICLNCHAGPGGSSSIHVMSPDGSALTPGGDFYWLTRSFSWLDGSSPGYDHGHNIIAVDYNLHVDPVLNQSPGGNYPAAKLSCVSCHDPHGQVSGGTAGGQPAVSQSGSYGIDGGNYRLLGDAGYQPPGGSSFVNDAPVARQSESEPYGESIASHVDYGAGMSAWCGNCHSSIVASRHLSVGSSSNFRHSTDRTLGNRFISMYNAYVNSGDLSGSVTNSYLQFLPFERGATILQQLDPNSLQGMDSNSRLTCLSCHRAHASAFSNAGRWDFTASVLVDSHPAIGDAGVTGSDVHYSYYGRDISTEFGANQGQFCEKCHGPSAP